MEVETIRANDHVGLSVDCHKRVLIRRLKLNRAAPRVGHAFDRRLDAKKIKRTGYIEIDERVTCPKPIVYADIQRG